MKSTLSEIQAGLANLPGLSKTMIAMIAIKIFEALTPTQATAQCDICPGNKESQFKIYIEPSVAFGQTWQVTDMQSEQKYNHRELSFNDTTACNCDTKNRAYDIGLGTGLQIGSDEGFVSVSGGIDLHLAQEKYGIFINQYDIDRFNLARKAGLRVAFLNLGYRRDMLTILGNSNSRNGEKTKTPHGSQTAELMVGKRFKLGVAVTQTKPYDIKFKNPTNPIQPQKNTSRVIKASYRF